MMLQLTVTVLTPNRVVLKIHNRIVMFFGPVTGLHSFRSDLLFQSETLLYDLIIDSDLINHRSSSIYIFIWDT